LYDDEEEDELVNAAIIFGSVFVYNSMRSRHYLTRQGVVHPKNSAWAHLYRNGDDSSCLELTGFSRVAFACLEADLFRIEDSIFSEFSNSIAQMKIFFVTMFFIYFKTIMLSYTIFKLNKSIIQISQRQHDFCLHDFFLNQSIQQAKYYNTGLQCA
jgi:hypothetical protein